MKRRLFTSSCLSMLPYMAAAVESDVIPRRFKASIRGVNGSSYEVELEGGVLLYRDPLLTRISPTPEEWRDFRQSINRIVIWNWANSYIDPAVREGERWSLDIEFTSQEVSSEGFNQYPDDVSRPFPGMGPSPAFNAYLSAVERLLGGKRFH